MAPPSTFPFPKTDKTRRGIIQAAEKLFAAKGFRAMTLRDVTREAHVNLAAVNYHFGSKRNLMRAVIRNRFEPINIERIRRLDALVEKHSPEPVPLEELFAALFRPLFEAANDKGAADTALMQVIGRAMTEPADFVRAMHKEFFDELGRRFLAEIKRSCPELPDEALQYRFFFAISTMLGSIGEQTRLENISRGKLNGADLDKIVQQLITYVVCGFRQSGAEHQSQ